MKVIITGAGSEIGCSICNFFLGKNYQVVACCHENFELIKKINNPNLTVVKIDLTKEEEIKKIFSSNFDVVINAAAYYSDCYYLDKTKDEFMRCFEVNVVAPFLIAKYSKCHTIINISSADGIDTYNEYSIDYCASKAALNNLTKTLALALKDTNVYALALGWVNTSNVREMNPTYLEEEMKKHHQRFLIEVEEINIYIKKILDGKYPTGTIIRYDGSRENEY